MNDKKKGLIISKFGIGISAIVFLGSVIVSDIPRAILFGFLIIVWYKLYEIWRDF